ncbi:T9SS type A sorting domain-containing protein [Hymenobacter sp. YC55]|uniref:T9SS type A sorting domain-containing protein n=1 Tax=Hymenobacter sp. YC55 TaxID=3034019 RepID=UPI0023F74CAA|nr:T9SS type A sorting domain-containing protein [Hymenobacter sp. YC55]MDF7812907.1 T9SS type A sorting domain-containing protein [Hymenobacter sp. YC55]
MKKLVLPILLAVTAVVSTAPLALAQAVCPAAPTPITVPGTISSDVTWTSNNVYLLTDRVYVTSGATLTIQPGTIIKGTGLGTLVIERGARLIADGTAAQPIVFTSNQPAGMRNTGDWGGIVILGRAPINQPGTPIIEGVPGRSFGGTDPNDNSGILRYVRIEYCGIALTPNNEINGLTMGGVGAGTIIDYVQVYASGDDSFEWFGGNVNAKHLVAVSAVDDDFDTDFGYSGKVQYAVSVRNPAVDDVSGSTAFESDNDANGSTLTPITSPVFSNVSAFLQNVPSTTRFTRALHLRRNTQISIFNSVFTGWPQGLTLDGGPAQTNATNGSLVLKNNVFAGIASPYTQQSGGSYNVQGFWEAAANANQTLSTIAALNLNADNFSFANTNGTPNGVPAFNLPANSPLVGGAAFSDAKLGGGFFDNVAYRGAFGPAGTANWAAGWTNFNPQTTCYNRPGLTLANKQADEQVQGLSVAPNPTEGAAKLTFELKKANVVTVRVLDVTGRTVAVVRNGQKLSTGVQNVELPTSLQAGLYVASVTTGETTQAVRFVVTK